MDRGKSPSNCLVSPRESFTNIPDSRLTLLPPRLQQAPYLPITALLLSARPPLMALRLSAGLSLCARLPIPLLSVPHVAGSVFCFHFFFFFNPPRLCLSIYTPARMIYYLRLVGAPPVVCNERQAGQIVRSHINLSRLTVGTPEQKSMLRPNLSPTPQHQLPSPAPSAAP